MQLYLPQERLISDGWPTDRTIDRLAGLILNRSRSLRVAAAQLINALQCAFPQRWKDVRCCNLQLLYCTKEHGTGSHFMVQSTLSAMTSPCRIDV